MISLAKIPNQLEVAKPAFAFEVRLENVSTKDYENFAIEERILARIYENATGEKVGFINLDSIASKVVGPPSGAPPKLPAEITDWKQHLDIDLPVNQFTDYIIQYVMINRPDGRPPALIVIEPEFEADFLDYTYNISEKYKDIMPVNVDQLSVGSLVVALFEDELYYRAQVYLNSK